MRASTISVSAAAIVAMVIVGGVVTPAQAEDVSVEEVRESPPQPLTFDDVWAPPENADDAVADESQPELLEEQPSAPDDAPDEASAQRAPAGTVAGAPGVGELPWFSFQDFAFSSNDTAQVNLANGNLLLKANDLAIAGPGSALRQDRFYNGLSDREGVFGGGWLSNNGYADVSFNNRAEKIFYGPNGLIVDFDLQPDGTWKAPAGYNFSLKTTPPTGTSVGAIVTDNKSNEKWEFSQRRLVKVTDGNNVGVVYKYNSADGTTAGNRFTTVTHDSGRKITLGYDAARPLQPATIEDSAARVVNYGYDSSNRLNSVTGIDGRVSTYTYDSTGRISSMTIPGSLTATTTVAYEYDSSHRVTKITQDGGVVTSFAYTPGLTVVTDPNGNTATYAIDASGRVTSTKDALNRTRTQQWTANNDVASTTTALGPSTTTTYTYDQSGNRLTATLPTGAASAAVYTAGTTCAAPTTGTAWQVKCSTDDAGNSKRYEYEGVNLAKVTNTTGGGTGAVEFERTFSGCANNMGQVCTSKDGNGHITSFAYDTHGNLTLVTPPAPLGTTSYSYDALGRVISVTDGKGDITQYQYDVRDRLVLTTFDNSQQLGSTYYPNGLEKTRTDTDGGALAYEYNHQGRITKQTGPNAGVVQTFTYDLTGNVLTYTDSTGTVTYTYDVANQLTTLKEPGGTCPTTGNPAANSGCVLFEYDQSALETKRILPGGANTVTTRDPSGRPTQITAKTGAGVTAVDIGYTYKVTGTTDDRAKVQTRTSYKEEGITAGAVTTYSYDSLNRLVLADEKAGATSTASWAYAYDPAGNRTSQTRTGATGAAAGTIAYGYNAANQLISTTGQLTNWLYDAAGNQTQNGMNYQGSSYGDRGETINRGSMGHGYFGVGNTERTQTLSTTFNSGALGIMQRINPAGTTSYTRTTKGTPIGARGASTGYYVQDHLGSIVGTFSAAGAFAGGGSYSPYGETRAGGAGPGDLGYIGGYKDDSNFYKLGARYYDASFGRFTQMDPSGQEASPFAYAAGDPINQSDPSGRSAIHAIGESLIAGLQALSDGKDFTSAALGEMSSAEALGVLAGALATFGCTAAAVAAGIPTAGAGSLLVATACLAISQTSSVAVEWLFDV